MAVDRWHDLDADELVGALIASPAELECALAAVTGYPAGERPTVTELLAAVDHRAHLERAGGPAWARLILSEQTSTAGAAPPAPPPSHHPDGSPDRVGPPDADGVEISSGGGGPPAASPPAPRPMARRQPGEQSPGRAERHPANYSPTTRKGTP
ncbi:MAG: hypothetical protein AB7V74_18760 [Acidimicrobiia bacterium]